METVIDTIDKGIERLGKFREILTVREKINVIREEMRALRKSDDNESRERLGRLGEILAGCYDYARSLMDEYRRNYPKK